MSMTVIGQPELGVRVPRPPTVPAGRVTLEEFLELCQHEQYADRLLELDEGRLIVTPPPSPLHGGMIWAIGAVFAEYSRRVGKGMGSAGPGVIVGGGLPTVRRPDFAYYRDKQHLGQLPDEVTAELPELVVEVLSPSDRMGAVMRKVQQYLRAGIALVWVVDAESRNVTVYRAGREPRVLEANEVLPGFACPVAELFHLPGAPTGASQVGGVPETAGSRVTG